MKPFTARAVAMILERMGEAHDMRAEAELHDPLIYEWKDE